MTRTSHHQPSNKESQEHANNQPDEREKLLSPDIDFPDESPGTGEEVK